MTAVHKKLSSQRLGELSGLSAALLWALFPILLSPALNPLRPLFFGAVSTLLAALPVAALIIVRRRWNDLKVWQAYPPAILASLLTGVLYYGIVFYATWLTSPVNGALLPLLEVAAAAFLLKRFRHERLTRRQAGGAALMLAGAVVLICPGRIDFNRGDLLLVAACSIPPWANVFAKRARALVGSEAILLIRSLLSGSLLLSAALVLEGTPNTPTAVSALPFLLLNGILLMGISKMLWVESIYRLSIPKATALMATAPAFTAVLSALVLRRPPTALQFAALLLVTVGLLLTVQDTAEAVKDPA